MYGREKLELQTDTYHHPLLKEVKIRYYMQPESDAVMDAMEARIKELEEELRTTKRALWLARAMNGYNTTHNETSYHNYMIEHPSTKVSIRRWFSCWNLVERKCMKKAEEYR